MEDGPQIWPNWPPGLGTNSSGNAPSTIHYSQSLRSPPAFRIQLCVQNMSLHVPIQRDQATPYSALSSIHSSPVRDGPRHIPILLYKHASKWNSTIYKHPEPFTVAFDTYGTLPGYGVHHGELASYSAALMSSTIVSGGELVDFPTPSRKIQFRIVWPGYDNVDFSALIDIQGITVSQLAGRVASLYTEFFKVARQHTCTATGWTVTPELLETLRIVDITNSYDNIYQAEIVIG